MKDLAVLEPDEVDGHRRARSDLQEWADCQYLSCSVLPVKIACNCKCPFCFSRSSISALERETATLSDPAIETYYEWARANGANRLVVTGGGEPLLKPNEVVRLISIGSKYFNEIACFTNGTFLTPEFAKELKSAGLSYFCFSRHHHNDEINRQLMGHTAPDLQKFLDAAGNIAVRATCVMTRSYVDTTQQVWNYVNALSEYGITEFTFKHTYRAYAQSVFQNSRQNDWVTHHQVEFDPFDDQGTVIGTLPWGPKIRRIGPYQVCYYFEPNPHWERKNKQCRSTNLMSDGKVYASLEDQQSLLFQLNS